MLALLQQIRDRASNHPHQPAIRDEWVQWDYAQLGAAVERTAGLLHGARIGLLLDNGVAWACLDLAILSRGSVCVPMPGFFSADQLRHLIDDADLDEIITDQPERMAELLGDSASSEIQVATQGLRVFRRQAAARTVLPRDTVKVTYTSGTTGQPKGVCLAADSLIAVTRALGEAVAARDTDRGLSLLPLSTLLENIAGVYVPLWFGALAQVPSLASCGFSGTGRVAIDKLFVALAWAQPTTTVLVPQLLKAVLGGMRSGFAVPNSLRFMAVGGAPLADSLLKAAQRAALPVFQGYGLSEAGSVVCLNLPDASREASVGKPLPHLRVTIEPDGEVVVHGAIHRGYLGAETSTTPSDAWFTGDLGYLDADGFLFLTGRKKTAYSTAHGRNVSPEWVEAALTGQACIAQAAVFGAGQPFNVAVLVLQAEIPPQVLAQTVAAVNQCLPEYAQIADWLIAAQPFSLANQQVSSSGSIQRMRIYADYQIQIESLYLMGQEEIGVVL